MIKYLGFLACVITVVSCNTDPVKVVVDKQFSSDSSKTSHWIVFDGKDSLKLADSAVSIKLKPGKHSFSLDKGAAKEFTVGEKGGLLNLDNNEYVAYEVEYAEQKPTAGSINFNSMKVNAVILIDSLVISTGKSFLLNSDSAYRKILPQLQASKNGNYFTGSPDYDNNDQIHGLKKFGKDRLFIDKFWDYDMDETLPETVEIRTSKYSIGTASTTKSTVMRANMFSFLAMLSEGEYKVKSLKDIREGKEDKVKEKEKAEKQMDF